MTSDKTPIYYALDKLTYLANNGVTVRLRVKKDGSFDMTVNPHLLGMIDGDNDEENDDGQDKKSNQRCQYCEITKYLTKPKDIYVGWRKNDFDSLMKEIQDYGILVNPHILRMIMEENQDKDSQK